MWQTKLTVERFRRANLPGFVAAAVLLVACFPGVAGAQQQGQKTFSSAEDATKALVAAAQSNDEKAMLEILGPDAKRIVSSGDDAEDASNRSNFVERYQEMHRLVKEPDGTTSLYVGAENWPMPIPLARNGKLWYFDTAAGKKEILYRRIGKNEMSSIRVCHELVAAEKEYSARHHEYAQRIFSDDGQQDGLYWKPAGGQPESPVGPLVASAVAEGSAESRASSPTPYRGYYFRILKAQGSKAPGGAKSYIANGKMNQGFAFIAYPAEYRSSGVMTFVISQQGIVYQRDLGPNTATLAKVIKDYNPDSSWQKSEDEAQNPGEQEPQNK